LDFSAKLDVDVDGDGYVDVAGLAILCQNWLSAGGLLKVISTRGALLICRM
jgi:hypothetical protein